MLPPWAPYPAQTRAPSPSHRPRVLGRQGGGPLASLHLRRPFWSPCAIACALLPSWTLRRVSTFPPRPHLHCLSFLPQRGLNVHLTVAVIGLLLKAPGRLLGQEPAQRAGAHQRGALLLAMPRLLASPLPSCSPPVFLDLWSRLTSESRSLLFPEHSLTWLWLGALGNPHSQPWPPGQGRDPSLAATLTPPLS